MVINRNILLLKMWRYKMSIADLAYIVNMYPQKLLAILKRGENLELEEEEAARFINAFGVEDTLAMLNTPLGVMALA